MTAEEKAKDLVDRFYYSLPNNGSFTGINNVKYRYKEAKQCALIAVDEILLACALETKGKFEYYLEVQKAIKQLT